MYIRLASNNWYYVYKTTEEGRTYRIAKVRTREEALMYLYEDIEERQPKKINLDLLFDDQDYTFKKFDKNKC